MDTQPAPRVGFTGTRLGMTFQQIMSLKHLLARLRPSELHLGDCEGADAQCGVLARFAAEAGNFDVRFIGHPPTKDVLRVHAAYDEEREPKDCLARDRAIVDETECLIAAPAVMEPRKGGTWYTYDYAMKKGRKTYLLDPEGGIEEQR